MLLNLEALGVTEAALTQAVLTELDLTPEQAVAALAEKLGVETPAQKAGQAVEVTEAEVNTLREALAIQTRILS